MTKGGTGDVLAGLVAALYAKNDSWTATTMASYINKKLVKIYTTRLGHILMPEILLKKFR